MPPEASGAVITALRAVDARFEPAGWDFARDRRAEIAAHWDALVRRNPHLWNGRVLLLDNHRVADGVLHSRHIEVDYASFLAWRDWGFPDRTKRNAFAMAALLSADGAFVLGRMAETTANAGKVYFPAGTPDPGDVREGTVDLAGSVRRELAEETGLGPEDVAFDPGWFMVLDDARLALMKITRAPLPAEALATRIRAFIAAEATPELADVVIVRSIGDLDATSMHGFTLAFLRAWFEGRLPSTRQPG